MPAHGEMNLVVDIGNTITKIAWFDKDGIEEVIQHEGDIIPKLKIYAVRYDIGKAIISNVSGINDKITEILKEFIPEVLDMDKIVKYPFRIVYRTPGTLGRDRLAAAAGAFDTFPNNNILVIDMGTAITFDFLSATGEYLGGNISPGMNTRFKSLHEYTARLPLCSKDESFPFFGYDTKSALIAGVQQGILFELQGYINNFSSLYPGCKVIITGGDAGFFKKKLPESFVHMPNLLLSGLNMILNYNVSN